MITLEDFKPKSISDDVWAYLQGKDCCISFADSTQVMLKGCLLETFPPSMIRIKDLFKGELDSANGVNEQPITFTLPLGLEWIEFPVNDLDLSVFSSIASSDTDLFWSSKVHLNSETNMLDILSLGLTYAISYKIPKNIEKSFQFTLRWSAFYYLYKLFKGVTKKKLGTIKIAHSSSRVFITSETEEVIIVCHQTGTVLEYKSGSFPIIEEFLSGISWVAKDPISKKLLTTTDNTLIKHLGKPFKETVSHFDSEQVDKYTDNLYYNLYMFKKR